MRSFVTFIYHWLLWGWSYPAASLRQRLHIMFDYLRLFHAKGLNMNEYYQFEFDKRSDLFRQQFLGENEQRAYLDLLNPTKYYIFARNKYVAHKMLEETGIRKSPLFAYYQPEGSLCACGDVATTMADMLRILRSKRVDACVIKSTESSHGDNVWVIQHINYYDEDAVLERYDGEKILLSEVLGTQPLLFEGLVSQTRQFSDFNESSVNTVRFMTALYPDGEAKLVATFIKIGRAGKCVDNAGGGGNVDVCVNPDTGTLQFAIQYDGWRHITDIERHPDTGNLLNGVVVDNWNSIKQQVLAYQQAFPYCKVAGWDIAITEDGPVVIEVNDMWDRTGQYFIRRGWRSDIRDCYLAWQNHYLLHPECKPVMGRLNQRLSSKHVTRIIHRQ